MNIVGLKPLTPIEAVQEAKKHEWIRYFAAIILPDGRTIFPRNGHINLLATIYGNGDPTAAWEDMEPDANAVCWLILHTGCAIVDFNAILIPYFVTKEQIDTLDLYRAAGLLDQEAEYSSVTWDDVYYGYSEPEYPYGWAKYDTKYRPMHPPRWPRQCYETEEYYRCDSASASLVGMWAGSLMIQGFMEGLNGVKEAVQKFADETSRIAEGLRE